MATTGLISLLLGSMVGGLIARTDQLGPAKVVLISSGLYVIAALFFWRLPDAVAVPANRRGADAEKAPKLTFPEYVRGIGEGLAYCLRHLHILGLIFFETVFWTLGSAFYVLLLFHARTVLRLSANEITLFFGLGLGFAGIGLFGGAIGIGKICHKVSPIVTYTPAFLLMAAGLYGVFHSAPVDGRAPHWVYAVLLGLGLGGGLTLGRVDADVLATTDEKMRGRVFSLKALAFAATILVTMLTITEAGLTDEQTRQLSLWLPRAIFLMLPLVFLFSWAVDIAAGANKAITSLPGPLHRFGYAAARFICWLFIKALFRYEVHGSEKIPRQGPCILAANHASFLDPMFLGCCTRRIVQWTMYASYYRSWAHPVFRFLRCIPVDEKSTTAALKANVRSLEQGACLGIFPEGHVSDDGKLQPPQPGAFFLAQRSGATVVPVAIKGNFEALPRHAKFPRPRKVEVFVLEPFTVPKDLSREQVAELAEKMMGDVAKRREEGEKGRRGEGETGRS
jgi:1-acyl-sn-glycerol-3-phosphate acyltransferase